jgi:hypothetical protein
MRSHCIAALLAFSLVGCDDTTDSLDGQPGEPASGAVSNGGAPGGGSGSGTNPTTPAPTPSSSSTAPTNGPPPIVIDAPTLVSPAKDARTDSIRPTFVFTDAKASGPAGPLQYTIEVADSIGFTNLLGSFTTPEQPTQTSLVAPSNLALDKAFFWRARANSGSIVGAWSAAETFHTPPEAIDLAQAAILNSPDVTGWTPTATITSVDIRPDGIHVDFTKRDGPDSWPDVTFITPGEDLEYTVWMVVNVGGKWYTSGGLEFWRGLDQMGGPPSQYAEHWYYDPGRWGVMTTHQPAVGELVGFFVTSGDQRNTGGQALVHERSKIVMLPFPTDAGAVFQF